MTFPPSPRSRWGRPTFLAGCLASVLLVCLATACVNVKPGSKPSPAPSAGSSAAEIRTVLDDSVKAWNAGDLERFMAAYHRGGRTRFASGDEVKLGWESVLARYQAKYADRAAMGHLTFSDVEVTVLAPDAAFVFGRFRLDRDHDTPTGLFTLLFRHTGQGWRIVHDHSSSKS